MKVDGSGNVELVEEDGIDYAAVTVQLPGGERVPFLFTVKNLQVGREGGGERGERRRRTAMLWFCCAAGSNGACRLVLSVVLLVSTQLAWHWGVRVPAAAQLTPIWLEPLFQPVETTPHIFLAVLLLFTCCTGKGQPGRIRWRVHSAQLPRQHLPGPQGGF